MCRRNPCFVQRVEHPSQHPRVAICQIVSSCDERTIARQTEVSVDHRSRPIERQRMDDEPAHRRTEDQRTAGRRLRAASRSHRHHEVHRNRLQPTRQELEPPERHRVRPLDVVDPDHHRGVADVWSSDNRLWYTSTSLAVDRPCRSTLPRQVRSIVHRLVEEGCVTEQRGEHLSHGFERCVALRRIAARRCRLVRRDALAIANVALRAADFPIPGSPSNMIEHRG